MPDDEVDAARTVVRAELERSLASITALELKATRLVTPFVALLTGGVALTIFQIAAVGLSLPGVIALVGAMLGSAGIGFLLMGMLRALDADTRLGTSLRATLEQELADDLRFALRSDHRGVEAAKFVLRKKGNRILFARAAISRGLLMLLLSSIAGALALALAPDAPDAAQPNQGPSTPASTPSPTLVGITDPTPTSTTTGPSPAAVTATTTRPKPGSPSPSRTRAPSKP